MTRFLLIAPKPPWEVDFRGLGSAGMGMTRVPSLAAATVAALAPVGIVPEIVDEAVEPVDFGLAADFVGITANISQAERAIAIARGFRARGRTVVIGGPHVSLDPSAFTEECDVMVIGEFEPVADEFYRDMLKGTLKPVYRGDRAEMSNSPIPAWQLIDPDRALIGIAQTSRGCPFECNFCDVIQYLGRRQRHKNDAQVVAELQTLYDLGFNQIQLADDNLTVYRKRATSLLTSIRDWNGGDGRDHVSFSTQVSIDIARDDEMLQLCAEAGLNSVFIGVETINQESLRASNKRQNLNVDLAAQVSHVVSHGVQVDPGLMVGFDADTLRIFEQQFEFAMQLPVATLKVSVLVAPVATPLYEQMRATGRLAAGSPLDMFPGTDSMSNILPAQMSREQLQIGARWLVSRLHSPAAFSHRLRHIARLIPPNPLRHRGSGKLHNPPGRNRSNRLYARLMIAVAKSGPDAARVIDEATGLMRLRPDIADGIGRALGSWALNYYSFVQKRAYDDEWARLPSPPFDTALRTPNPVGLPQPVLQNARTLVARNNSGAVAR
jgi:hypothetical protein